MILCGGQGLRLRPALPGLPKILAPIGGRPFVRYQLRALAGIGIRRATLCTGYMAGAVARELGERAEGVDLLYSPEETPLDTGGALRQALPHVRGNAVLVLNGDSHLHADLSPLVAPMPHAPPCLLAAVALDDAGRFGRLLFDKDGAVTAFVEKGPAGPGHINAGIYRFTREALAAIPAGRPVSLEREVFPGLIGRGLTAWPVRGAFLDIGTPESYAVAETFFGTGEPARVRPEAGARPTPTHRGPGVDAGHKSD